jgi:hypothetical protein
MDTTENKPDIARFMAILREMVDTCPSIGYQLHEGLDPKGWWHESNKIDHAVLSERLTVFREAMRRLWWTASAVEAHVFVTNNV